MKSGIGKGAIEDEEALRVAFVGEMRGEKIPSGVLTFGVLRVTLFVGVDSGVAIALD